MAGLIKMPLGIEVDLGPGDFVLDGDPAAPPQKGGGAPPQFWAHVHCGQTTGWIKMALDIEVGLGPGYMLDWGPAPLPNFRPIFIMAKRLVASRCHSVRGTSGYG